ARDRRAFVQHREDLAVRAEDLLEHLRVATGERRRAEIAQTFGVDVVVASAVRIDLRGQALLYAFAHHRALLAWNREHVRFGFRRYRPAERDVQVLARPIVELPPAIPELQIVDTELARQLTGVLG